MIHAQAEIKFSGNFELSIVNAKTGKERFHSKFPNIIVNQGLNNIGNGISVAITTGTCSVGTNSATPSVNDTYSTFSNRADQDSTLSTDYYHDSATPQRYTYVETVRVFNPGTADGLSLTEIGMGNGSSVLWSRTLIKDESGDPTTIVLASDEYLYVTYRCYRHWFVEKQTGEFDILVDGSDNQTYDYEVLPMYANEPNSFNYWFATGTIPKTGTFYCCTEANLTTSEGVLTSTGTGTTTLVLSSYTNDTFYRDITITASPTQCNKSGGAATWMIVLSTSGGFQMKFVKQGTPDGTFGTNIPKDNTRTLTLVFRFKWNRHEELDGTGALSSGSASISGTGTKL